MYPTLIWALARTICHILRDLLHDKRDRLEDGIGTLTVYGIVTQTGGYIFVESYGLGKGACFTIYFRHDAAVADDDWEKTADGDGQFGNVTGGGTVLLVEDEDPVCLFGARA